MNLEIWKSEMCMVTITRASRAQQRATLVTTEVLFGVKQIAEH